MDTTTVILLLCCMSCSTVLSQIVLHIYNSQDRFLPVGQSLSLTCLINKGLPVILDYTIRWIHLPLVSVGAEESVLSEQQSLSVGNANYGLTFLYTAEQCNVTLDLKNAQSSMDGKYICRAVPLEEGGKTLEKEVIVMVPENVQFVQLDFDDEEVRSVAEVTVEREEGEYGISCSTGGSNPSATVQLYLGDNPVPAPQSNMDGRDEAAEDSAGARRFQNALSLTQVKLTAADDDGKTLKCVAKAEFEGAVEKVASFPLQITALDSSGASFPAAAYSLCLLLSVLVWSL